MRWGKKLPPESAVAYRDGLRRSITGRYTDASEQHPVITSMRWERTSFLLDAGCGTGRFFAHAARGQPFAGLDLSLEMLKVARNDLQRGWFAVGDLEHLPFRDDVFDEVICVRVLQHIRNQERAVRECARVCKPNGTMILLSYNAWSLLAVYKVIRMSWVGRVLHFPLKFVPGAREFFAPWSFEYDNYCSLPELQGLFRRAGLRCVETQGATIGLPWVFQYFRLGRFFERVAPGLLEAYFQAARGVEDVLGALVPFKYFMDKVVIKGVKVPRGTR